MKFPVLLVLAKLFILVLVHPIQSPSYANALISHFHDLEAFILSKIEFEPEEPREAVQDEEVLLLDSVSGAPNSDDRRYMNKVDTVYRIFNENFDKNNLIFYENALGGEAQSGLIFFRDRVITEAFIKFVIQEDRPLLLNRILETVTIPDIDEDSQVDKRLLLDFPVRILHYVSDLEDSHQIKKYFEFFLLHIAPFYPLFSIDSSQAGEAQRAVGHVQITDLILFISQVLIKNYRNPSKFVKIISVLDTTLDRLDRQTYTWIQNLPFLQLLVPQETTIKMSLAVLLSASEAFITPEPLETYWQMFGTEVETKIYNHNLVFTVLMSFKLGNQPLQDAIITGFFKVYPEAINELPIHYLCDIPLIQQALRSSVADFEGIIVKTTNMLEHLINDLEWYQCSASESSLRRKHSSIVSWPNLGVNPIYVSLFVDGILFRLVKFAEDTRVGLSWTYIVSGILGAFDYVDSVDRLANTIRFSSRDNGKISPDLVVLLIPIPEVLAKLSDAMPEPSLELLNQLVQVLKRRTLSDEQRPSATFKEGFLTLMNREYLEPFYRFFGGPKAILTHLLQSETLDVESSNFFLSTVRVEGDFEIFERPRDVDIFQDVVEDEFDNEGDSITVTWARLKDPFNHCEHKIFLKSK